MSSLTTTSTTLIREVVDDLRQRLGQPIRAVIELGSGMGDIVQDLREQTCIPFESIPGFPTTTVAGHGGALLVGTLAGIPTVVQTGRVHLYEGRSLDQLLLPSRVLAELGATTFVFTNAAGGIRDDLSPGALMLIEDHFDLLGRVLPVRWPHPALPVRPAPNRSCFDPSLNRLIQRAARRAGIPLATGVYAVMSGPSYETAAEIRMLQRMGADAVGMSTVPTALALAAQGVRCAAISLITNRAAGLADQPPSHQDVLAASHQAGNQLGRLLSSTWQEMTSNMSHG